MFFIFSMFSYNSTSFTFPAPSLYCIFWPVKTSFKLYLSASFLSPSFCITCSSSKALVVILSIWADLNDLPTLAKYSLTILIFSLVLFSFNWFSRYLTDVSCPNFLILATTKLLIAQTILSTCELFKLPSFNIKFKTSLSTPSCSLLIVNASTTSISSSTSFLVSSKKGFAGWPSDKLFSFACRYKAAFPLLLSVSVDLENFTLGSLPIAAAKVSKLSWAKVSPFKAASCSLFSITSCSWATSIVAS